MFSDERSPECEQELLDFVNFNGLDQINRTVNAAGNVLDLCLTNVREVSEGAVTYPVVPVDKWHPPFTVTVPFPFVRHSAVQPPSYDFIRGDYFGLYAHFSNTDWDIIYENDDLDRAVSLLLNIMKSAMASFIPLKRSARGKFPWWFSCDLKKAMVLKSRFHKKYKSTGLERWHSLFKEQRTMVKLLLKRDRAIWQDS